MQKIIRPVSIGLLLGLLGLIFGLFWATYMVIKHEHIHKILMENRQAAIASKFVVSKPVEGTKESAHNHGHGDTPHKEGVARGARGLDKTAQAKEEKGHNEGVYAGEHEDPIMDAAHERLTRGHIHAMGLGVLTIAVSLMLVFLNMPSMIKTFTSACLGVGGLFYPLSWIIMGFRTVSMGETASAESVLPIVAISVPLVITGLFITLFYFLKDLFTRH